jgi:maleate isomerase
MTNQTWQPDGWGEVVRLGVLTPHADVGPESELQAMAPDAVVIHAARVPFGAMAGGGRMDPTIALAPVRAFAEPPFIDDAAERLAAAPLHAIGVGFTSTAYAIGADGEAQMLERLRSRTRGIPVTTACAAGLEALRALAVERLALVAPPWFDDELDRLSAAYFRAAGLDVVFSSPAGLQSDQRAIEPADLHAWVTAHVPDDAEAVFIGGNGFRAVGAIDALERDLGRPVLTANQVLLWGLLGLAGATAEIDRYGRIFVLPAPAA